MESKMTIVLGFFAGFVPVRVAAKEVSTAAPEETLGEFTYLSTNLSSSSRISLE